MALTDTGIRQIKHSGAPAGDKLSDGGGMYLLVTATAKCWRMNYRFHGKQKTLALVFTRPCRWLKRANAGKTLENCWQPSRQSIRAGQNAKRN
jgi:hypothetical protein